MLLSERAAQQIWQKWIDTLEVHWQATPSYSHPYCMHTALRSIQPYCMHTALRSILYEGALSYEGVDCFLQAKKVEIQLHRDTLAKKGENVVQCEHVIEFQFQELIRICTICNVLCNVLC